MTFDPEFDPVEDSPPMSIAESNQQIAWVLTEWLALYQQLHEDDVEDHPASHGRRS